MGASDHSHLPYFHDARRKGDALDAFDRFLAGADVDQPVAGHPEGVLDDDPRGDVISDSDDDSLINDGDAGSPNTNEGSRD